MTNSRCESRAEGHAASLLGFLARVARVADVAKPCAVPQELGWYDPLRKETNLNAPAIKKWLAVGAQPSDTVERLLKKAMVME